MKNHKSLKLIVVLVVAFMLMLSTVYAAEFEKVEGDKECIVYVGSVEVDGEIDDIWEHAPEISVDVLKENASKYFGDSSKVAGKDYAKLTCKALWDPDANLIYVLYIVEDKLVTQAASLDWEKDSVELFIDLDNVRTGAKDGNTFQKRIYADETRDCSDSTMTSVYKKTDNGYIVELSHVLHKDFKAGGYIGIDFQCNDDADGSGARHACLGWSDSKDKASSDTTVWGQALLTDIDVTEKDKDPGDEDPKETDPGDEDPKETEPNDEEPADTEEPTPAETEPGDEDESPQTSDAGIALLFVTMVASLLAGLFTISKKQRV